MFPIPWSHFANMADTSRTPQHDIGGYMGLDSSWISKRVAKACMLLLCIRLGVERQRKQYIGRNLLERCTAREREASFMP